MSLANLHPSHPTEPTPIFAAVQRDHYGAEAREIVRNGLRLVNSREAQSRAPLRVVHDSRYVGVGVLRAVSENA